MEKACRALAEPSCWAAPAQEEKPMAQHLALAAAPLPMAGCPLPRKASPQRCSPELHQELAMQEPLAERQIQGMNQAMDTPAAASGG